VVSDGGTVVGVLSFFQQKPQFHQTFRGQLDLTQNLRIIECMGLHRERELSESVSSEIEFAPSKSSDRMSRPRELLRVLSYQGVMTADDLEAGRVWLKGPQRESFFLGSLQVLQGLDGHRRVLSFLRANPSLNVFWIEQEARSYPPGMEQLCPGLLQRTLFCDSQGDFEDAQWSTLQGLRSGLFQAFVLRLGDSSLLRSTRAQHSLRRFRVEVERAQAVMWLLEPER
jgi:hypothetical protein